MNKAEKYSYKWLCDAVINSKSEAHAIFKIKEYSEHRENHISQENKELRAKLYSYGETIRRQEEEEDELIRERIALKSRIEELESGIEEAKYMLKLKSVGTIGDKPIIEKLETLTQEKDD